MRKIMVMMTMAVAAAVSAPAADVSAYVDFASAYVFRGVTLNNGFVMQPGLEAAGFAVPEEYGSVAVGIWGNYDIDDEDGAGSDFSEIDYYVSYSLPVEAVDVSVGYIEYTYPNGGTADKELNLTLGSALGTNGLYASFGINYGVGGAIDDVWYLQPSLDYETDISDALSASVGVSVGYVIADGDTTGFNDATASVSVGYALNDSWSVSAGLTYIAQLDEAVLSDDDYDVAVVGTVGVGCDF
ncbi:TorF family putative porin [Tichowtungia aerotolerans]|uniref:Uncharacterized protein n=1 Tax=Tichowtungia aerotolerans TaxID=2697043 RepID=A0A6P1M5X0_9BACT|nr:hypothetical protein [Tichowtungia aerotolerans]QHI69257.1 hypothetical protein GT409_07265 [Tichowtungia aerotolerans]